MHNKTNRTIKPGPRGARFVRCYAALFGFDLMYYCMLFGIVYMPAKKQSSFRYSVL